MLTLVAVNNENCNFLQFPSRAADTRAASGSAGKLLFPLFPVHIRGCAIGGRVLEENNVTSGFTAHADQVTRDETCASKTGQVEGTRGHLDKSVR